LKVQLYKGSPLYKGSKIFSTVYLQSCSISF